VTEEKYIKFVCVLLKAFAWAMLLFGIAATLAFSAVLLPLALINRWAGVVLLAFFLAVFLCVNLQIKIARMLVEIKKKLGI
jgi:hypothetical protein